MYFLIRFTYDTYPTLTNLFLPLHARNQAGKTLDFGGGSIEGAPKNGFGMTPFFPLRSPISRREMSKSRLQRMTPEDDVPGGVSRVRIANKGSSGWVLRL